MSKSELWLWTGVGCGIACLATGTFTSGALFICMGIAFFAASNNK
jgi:hypothetical protein